MINKLKVFGAVVFATTLLLGSTVSASRIVNGDITGDVRSYATEIQMNKKYQVNCQEGVNDSYLFKFTPSETGKYTFVLDDRDLSKDFGVLEIYEDNIDQNSNLFFYYSESSALVKTVILTKGHTYYLDAFSNTMLHDCSFTFTITGYIKLGWNQIDGVWYYYDKNYARAYGFCMIGGSYYYFGSNGIMKTGWLYNYDYWYYLGTDGKMRTGWNKIGDYWYYFGDETDSKVGAMYVGKHLIGDHYYYFDENGHMLKNCWINFESNSYQQTYIDENGYVADHEWKKIGGVWYYFDVGCIKDSTYLIDGNYYFFDENGHMRSGGWLQNAKGSWFYSESDGRLAIGWKKINGYWYYFNVNPISHGFMLCDGVYYLDGAYYCFLPSGEMYTGWLQRDGYWYYYGTDGARVTGWKQLSGVWYYFDYGVMLTGTHVLGGNTYVFDDNGHLVSES